MSNEVYDFNIGHSTAYAYAKASGDLPEGMTPEEYGELLASYATVGQTAVTAAQTATTKASEAATAATTATNKASEATTAATTATTKAGEASTSASTATSAKDTAVSASQTATTKATEATTAAATATSAKTDAVAANTAAQSAKTAAQTAQTGAETAAASVSASAAQIATNAEDISQLKSEITDKSDTADMLKAFPTDTASGSVASFADGANVPVKSLIVNIDPVQSGSGDPSPDNVRPISGWDAVNVHRTGKNLWDGLNYTSGEYLVDTGDTNTNNLYGYTDYIPVAPDSTYYVSGISGSNPSICWYDNGKNFIGGEKNNGATSKIISVPSNAHFIRVSFLLDNVDTLMVNYPTTDHDYHPYNGQSINIPLGQTVYGGTLDVVSGELTIDRKLIEINGNCTRWASPTGDWIGANTQSITDMQDGRLMNLICNMLPSIDGIVNGWNIYAVNKILYITLQKAIVGDSIGPVNAWLASNPVQVIYPLATPLTISLTPHEVTALLGSNNVWADSGDSEVTYRADPTLYIQRLTVPDADMVADANITSGQYFMVGNTLYKATANIASGATISPNVNCTRKSLSEALNELNA